MEAMALPVLQELKHQQRSAVFLLYMWDSLELKKISDRVLKLFDCAYTFDRHDAKKFKMILLDLFFSQEYQKKRTEKIKYDLCFVGTIHGDRYRILREIESISKKIGLRTYHYFFMPSRILFWARKAFDRDFRRIKYSDVNFISLDAITISKKMAESVAIIDLSYKNQKGLSMRTFEVLAARKKLITTHSEVRNYDFFNSENIYVINKENIVLEKEFFLSSYKMLREDIYEKYSLKKWLETIFDRSHKPIGEG
jgi:hypothetical protein